ncbi:FAD-binding domain-containing protein [Marasmius fiardii PR-910]|nr:FAD-binding domain-containing protein [Marasmius fiardii PR-910]
MKLPIAVLALWCAGFVPSSCASTSSEHSGKQSDTIQECCTPIFNRFPTLLKFSASEDYEPPLYYSLRQSEMIPFCRFTPMNAHHVSAAVRIAKEHQCPFAVRSGGGMFWPGASNIAGGVLIDLVNLRSLELEEENNVVKLGPSLSWGEVYKTMSPFNLTTLGGRLPIVGVGGFLLHGGISFLSFDHGFGSNSVVNFEVVLANGAIVNANNTSFPDLHWALKFGSTNFGIVTRLDMITYPIPSEIWARTAVYKDLAEDAGETLFDDWLEYVAGHSSDTREWATITYEKGANITGTFHAHFDGTPRPLLIPAQSATPILDSTGMMNFHDYMESLIAVAGREPKRIAWNSITVRPDPEILKDFRVRSYEACEVVEADVKGFECVVVYQAITKGFIAASQEHPFYDVLNEAEGDLILLLLELAWESPEDDGKIENVISNVRAWTEVSTRERGVFNRFVYPNYASGNQDVYVESLSKASLAKMMKVKQKYDPENVYGRLWKGGFKLPIAVKDSYDHSHDRTEL